jgi:signal transduction histidine kinase
MVGSRRSSLFAWAGFAVLVAVILGGMSWATVTTLRLAELDGLSEETSRIRLALWQMDSFLAPVLSMEAGREYMEYSAVYRPAPDSIWRTNGDPVDPMSLIQASPLLTGSKVEWISMYFQVDPNGRWTSPQAPDLNDPCVLPFRSDLDERTVAQVNDMLTGLANSVPVADLGPRVSPSEMGVELAGANAPAGQFSTAAAAADSRVICRNKLLADYQQRTRAHNRMQKVPQDICVRPDLLQNNVSNSIPPHSTSNKTYSELYVPSALSLSPLISTWACRCPSTGTSVTSEDAEHLVFARTANLDGELYYQGFVVCWDTLKPLLLAEIEELYPDADLQPLLQEVPDDGTFKPTAWAESRLTTIPVELLPHGSQQMATASVWRPAHTTLVLIWCAALCVIGAAWLGIRSLLGLTERRLQFAYAVTHELRTPLTTFRLYADMLAAGLVPEERKQEYLDTINNESQRLSTLVEAVLEYARLEHHNVKLNPTETNGEALLEKLRASLEDRCRMSNVEFVTDNHVPDGMSMKMDVDVLGRVAGVLVNNACRHAMRSEDAAVYLSLGAENGHLQVDVIDTGEGVDAEDAHSIFRPFRRGRSAKINASGGIGLGLALARSWTHLLGGQLELVSRKHPKYGGAHFRMSLPREE